MRTAPRHSGSLPRWAARQRRGSWVVACVIVASFVGLLIYRSAASTDPASVAPRVIGRVVQWGGASGMLLIADDAGPRTFDLLGVAWPLDTDSLARLAPPDTRLILSFDPDLRDRPGAAGRPLVYAYLPDGRMLNELLLAEGNAVAAGDPPHGLDGWFGQIEGRARRRQAGRWGADAADPVASGSGSDTVGRGAGER